MKGIKGGRIRRKEVRKNGLREGRKEGRKGKKKWSKTIIANHLQEYW